MDTKQAAILTVIVLGSIGLLAVSCTEDDDEQVRLDEVGRDLGQGDSAVEPPPEVHWSYEGDGAPFFWGDLKEEFAVCKTGRRQSPIDISTVTITDLPKLNFDYKVVPMVLENDGHTIKANYAPGSSLTISGKRFELQHIHFHSPSEHTIGGKAYQMVAHLVHKADDGQLTVVAIMFKQGDANNAIGQLWAHMPEQAGETYKSENLMMDASDFLPKDFTYFSYTGSLTTPPCNEGVNWLVMATPIQVGQVQVDQFTEMFYLSTRPTQPLNGRTIRVSN